MTKYLLEVSNEFWQVFRTTALLQGLKVKEAVPEALLLFVEKYKTANIQIDVKVFKNNKKNLLTFVYEEEIKNKLEALLQAKRRKAPNDFIVKLKNDTLEILKKHPAISEDLAEQVVTVFKNIQ